jgi:hypothetical protein
MDNRSVPILEQTAWRTRIPPLATTASTCLPVSTSQTRTVPSKPLEDARLSSGENATDSMRAFVWPTKTRWGFPLAASNRLSLPSPQPMNQRLPSCDQAAQPRGTSLSCLRTSRPVRASQMRMVLPLVVSTSI